MGERRIKSSGGGILQEGAGRMATEYVVTDEEVYCRIPAPQYGENVCRTETILTRDAFVECYKRWILKDKEIARVTSGNSDYPYVVGRVDE